jgi:hypothetical protein
MPGGLSWQQYIVFSISAITTMFIGASIVHNTYKPNLTIPSTSHSLPTEKYENKQTSNKIDGPQ